MELMSFSVAQSTLGKRRASWKHWMNFRREQGLQGSAIQPSELDICLWLTYLFNRKLLPSTIKVYMYALSAEIKFRGGTSFIKPLESWFIRATIRAIEKKADPSKIILRQPLTTDLLKQLAKSVNFSEGDNFLYITMLYVGVFGLFRINELCYTKKDKVGKFIRFKDVKFFAGHATISIFNTKTCPKVVKVIGKVGGTKDDPFTLLYSFYNSKASRRPEAPIFATKKNIPVTRIMIVKFLQEKMSKICPNVDPKSWNGISLRKGGATSAIRAGVPSEIIQKLGSWKTHVYTRYIVAEEHDIIKAQTAFAQQKE